jgi:hypothetical protein
LLALAHRDAVANVFILSHLESAGTASPTPGGASIFGVFDGGTLLGACWAGANLVPVQLDPDLAGPVAMAAHRSWPSMRPWSSSASQPTKSATTSPC